MTVCFKVIFRSFAHQEVASSDFPEDVKEECSRCLEKNLLKWVMFLTLFDSRSFFTRLSAWPQRDRLISSDLMRKRGLFFSQSPQKPEASFARLQKPNILLSHGRVSF